MNVRRMFLTVWPNEAQIEQLYQLQGDYIGYGKEVSPENLHMTLLFMGDMPDDPGRLFDSKCSRPRC